MKHIIRFFITVITVALLAAFFVIGISAAGNTTEFAGGTGTEADPYLIANKTHLNNVRNYLSAHFKMTADITLDRSDFLYGGVLYDPATGGAAGWVAIGTPETPFRGTFDGKGHTITGLYQNVSSTATAYGGLFGYTTGATIKNLGMVGSDIRVTATSGSSIAGGIVGYHSSTIITNCYNTGTVTGNGVNTYVGGIAGYVDNSTISNCYNTGAISGSNAGGIVGYDGNVTNCYNTGTIIGIRVGGISGIYGTATDCYNVGIVGGNYTGGTYVGGIAGGYGNITNCYYIDVCNRGIHDKVDAGTKVSIAQMQTQSTFADFDFDTVWQMGNGDVYPFPTLRGMNHVGEPEVNTTEFAGGKGTAYAPYLIDNKTHLNNVRNYPDAHFKMTADIVFTDADFASGGAFYNGGAGWEPIGQYSAAFHGTFDGDGHTVTGLYVNISSDTNAYGGLFGYTNGATVATINNLGMVDSNISVTTTSRYAYAGGIVGYADGFTTINNCYNTGAVNSGWSAGGIVGSANYATISNCYNTGTISSDYYAGGIVGDANYAITISNCYNIGTVAACGDYPCAGGIVGIANYATTISNCYNMGEIWSDDEAGGISGVYGNITNCYYLDNIDKGVGYGTDTAIKCTDAQVRYQGTFIGFNFANVWTMGGNQNYPYPELISVPYNRTGSLISGVALSWNNTDDAVYVLYASTVTDDAIKAEWAAGNYTGIVCTGKETPVSVTVDGKAMYSQTFSFYEMANGNYKLAIFKPGKYVPKIVEVTVSDSNVNLGQQKLWLYGDVNYDGKIRAGDATQVLQYIAKTRELTEEQIAAADVTRDGKIRAGDATQIKRYIAKMESSFNSMK